MLIILGGWSMMMLGQDPGESGDYQYALIEAVKQKNLGNIREAVKLYRLVIREKPDCDAAYYELGTIYMMSEREDEAREHLAEAYELQPDNQWYTLAYLNVLASEEDYGKAARILKKKLRMQPEEVEWEYQLAHVRYSQNRPGRAIRILEGIEKERGFSEKITLLKASIYESQGKYEMAGNEIEKVMKLFPEALQFRIVAAELSIKNGDEDAAAGYYHEILDMDSTNIFALTNLTDYYRKKNEYGKSFKYLIKSFRSGMIEFQRKLAIMSYYLSEDKFITQYPEEIEKMLKVLDEMHPQEADVKLMAADFYMEIRDYEEAYFKLKDYLEIKDGNYQIYMQTIMLANAASMNEELIKITEQALLAFPDSADLRFFRGIGLYEEDRYEELVENFEKVPFDNYSRGEYTMQANMLYAEALYRLQHYARSDSVFEQMIREDPGNYMVLNNYSYYLAERGEKLEKAREWSSQVIRNHPDNFTYLDTYAWVLYKIGHYEDAEKYILEALDKGGSNDPEVNEHAGDIQMALGSYEMAMSYYRKAIILGGDSSEVQEKIDQIGENQHQE